MEPEPVCCRQFGQHFSLLMACCTADGQLFCVAAREFSICDDAGVNSIRAGLEPVRIVALGRLSVPLVSAKHTRTASGHCVVDDDRKLGQPVGLRDGTDLFGEGRASRTPQQCDFLESTIFGRLRRLQGLGGHRASSGTSEASTGLVG